jgi:glucose-1-phosphate thymidylyltransferase
MKGIILAGGNGTRLRPLTLLLNKHLLPVYDKPMILYPIETLKSLGISDVLLVSGGEHIGKFTDFLGDGSEFDINLTYRVQKDAGGIAQALGLAKDFAASDDVVVILGDNIFDNRFVSIPQDRKPGEAVLYGKKVPDSNRFGVIEIAKNGTLRGIKEKPKNPKSNIAVTGLYVYPSDVFEVIPHLKPSARGELEITDINNQYIKEKRCVLKFVSGFWSDAGTFDSLFKSYNWAKEK